MTELWESCPMKEKPTHQSYDLMRPFESATYKLDLEMWSFLEKVKVELDKIEAVKTHLTEYPDVDGGICEDCPYPKERKTREGACGKCAVGVVKFCLQDHKKILEAEV